MTFINYIYSKLSSIFFVVVFCPPHLTAGGPKPTTNFTHLNKNQLKMKKFLRHIFTINKLILKFVFFFLPRGVTSLWALYLYRRISIVDHHDDDLAQAPLFINYVPKSW